MLYLAYGSNLNKRQMSRRCPAAIPIGPIRVPRARLVFRGVADVEYAPEAETFAQCGLWKITRQCERELDIYEGVRGGLYRKEYLLLGVTRDGKQTKEQALIYLMNREGYGRPSEGYFETIREGFGDFAMDTAPLFAAVAQWARQTAREGA